MPSMRPVAIVAPIVAWDDVYGFVLDVMLVGVFCKNRMEMSCCFFVSLKGWYTSWYCTWGYDKPSLWYTLVNIAIDMITFSWVLSL